jgi:hypothetical protein
MNRPLTLIEKVVTSVVVVLLSLAVVHQITDYQRHTEALAVRTLMHALRDAMRLKAAGLGGIADPNAHVLAGTNPIAWLDEPPANYAGEVNGADVETMKEGTWVFDPRDKTLNYLSFSEPVITFSRARLLKFKVEWFRKSTLSGSAGQENHRAGLALVGADGVIH